MLPYTLKSEKSRLGTACLSALAIACLGLTIHLSAQRTPPNPTVKPNFSITAHEVLLDVVVVDGSGHPVTGLTPADFTVTEEGAPQVIHHLDEHHPMSAADFALLKAGPVMPPNTFTDFSPVVNTNASTVILLDAMDTPIVAQQSLRQQLIGYLKHAQPGVPIAIFQLDTDMHLIQGFSSDPKVLLAAAESNRNTPSLARPIKGNYYYYHKSHLETLRDGMRMMGRYLSAFPGRKNLIWFTGQVPLWRDGAGFGNPFHDSFGVDIGDDLLGLTDVLTVSRVAVYPVDTRGLQINPQYTAAYRDAPSPSASLRFLTHQTFDHTNLDEIANATGGKAYYNGNDFKKAIAEATDNGNSYYTLAYATSNAKWDGQFRRVKITVNCPNVHLQYRDGYYANSHDQQEQNQIANIEKRQAAAVTQQKSGAGQNSNPPPGTLRNNNQTPIPNAMGAALHGLKGSFDASMELGAIPPTEILFLASFRPDDQVQKMEKKSPLPQDNYLRPQWQNKPFRNYAIVIDADVHRIKLTQSSDGARHGTVKFVTVVYDSSGDVVNSFERTASLGLGPDPYRKLLESGLPVREEIAVPVKGNYFLRIGVHDVDGDQIGAVEIPVDQIQLGVAGAAFRKP
jgi:VWFA-related protein